MKLPSIVAVYGMMVIGFQVANLVWGGPPSNAPRVPTVRLHRPARSNGLPFLDLARLRSSVARLPAVSFLRRLGNGIRVVLGQRLDWVIPGSDDTLFLNSDLWVSRGINSPVERRELAAIARRAASYVRLLRAEGWKVVLLPVPTKFSIHGKRAKWPVMAADPLTRRPVPRERSAEVITSLTKMLRDQGLNVVDLYRVYQDHLRLHPQSLMYPPGESHWSGLGLQLAADATADFVSKISEIPRRHPVPRYREHRHRGDLYAAYDVHDWFAGPLAHISHYNDRLVDGDAGKGYTFPARPTSLVAVVGTSYTGQYTWLPLPVGFSDVLGGRLRNAQVQNRSRAGRGSMFPMSEFVRQRHEIESEFARKAKLRPGSFPKAVVWEFPVRDCKTILTLPVLRSISAPRPRVRPTERVLSQEACVGCQGSPKASGLHGQEANQGTRFHWATGSVVLSVRLPRAGDATLVLRLLTAFAPGQAKVAVRANGGSPRVLSFSGTNFRAPQEYRVRFLARAGMNKIRLRFLSDWRAAFAGDPRDIAFGLALPLRVSVAP